MDLSNLEYPDTCDKIKEALNYWKTERYKWSLYTKYVHQSDITYIATKREYTCAFLTKETFRINFGPKHVVLIQKNNKYFRCVYTFIDNHKVSHTIFYWCLNGHSMHGYWIYGRWINCNDWIHSHHTLPFDICHKCIWNFAQTDDSYIARLPPELIKIILQYGKYKGKK